jgi:hypothetical protein
MRLFEVDLGGARDIMAVLQGLANNDQQDSKLPWPVVQNILNKFSLGISTPDGLIALKNAVDPNGDVIKDVDAKTGTVTLNTTVQGASDQEQSNAPKAAGPNVSAMASSNTDLTPNL